MLIHTKSSQLESPLEGLNLNHKGQALPQEAKFSELFASMFSSLNGDETDSINANKLDLKEGDSNLDSPEFSELTGLVNLPEGYSLETIVSNEKPLESVILPVESENPVLSDTNIMSVVDKLLGNQSGLEIAKPEMPDDVQFVIQGIEQDIPAENLNTDAISVSENQVYSEDLNDPLEGSLGVSFEALTKTDFSETSHSKQPDVESYDAGEDQSLDVNTDGRVLSMANTIGDAAINQQAMTSSQNVASVTTASTTATTGNASNAQMNSMTSWGNVTTNSDNASQSGFSQQSGQSSGQGAGQNGAQQSFAGLHQSLPVQEQKALNLEQQMAVKATEALIAKTDSKEGLMGLDAVTSERRGALPLALQSIPLPVRSPQWGQALGQRVVFMANNQLQQAQITLNPEKLGPVQVKLHMDKEQQVHVTMNAQHLTTREAMENALPRLREMLEQAGINLASVDIGDHSNFAENKEGDSERNNLSLSKGEDEADMPENTMIQNAVGTDNIVDYYA